jgi:hypothetical protein
MHTFYFRHLKTVFVLPMWCLQTFLMFQAIKKSSQLIRIEKGFRVNPSYVSTHFEDTMRPRPMQVERDLYPRFEFKIAFIRSV